MATIVTWSRLSQHFSRPYIYRLKQEQLKNIKLSEAKISFFKGQKNTPMPKEFCATSVLPLKSIMWTSHSLWEGKNEDFQFIKSLIQYDKTPDHNRYNTMNFRNNSQSLKSKTEVIFTPLLDRTPSHPSK